MSEALVYLAGSSLELDRARRWHGALIQSGITVVSTWIANVTRVGQANPRDASPAERRRWATTCLGEVSRCDVFWLLVPDTARPTKGAWLELGVAYFASKALVLSGDTRSSIFGALGTEMATDQLAFAEVLVLAGMSKRAVGR